MNTTAKRFFKYTWQDPKFTKLTPEEKLMYKYIWESSDIAGVHQVHKAIPGDLDITGTGVPNLKKYLINYSYNYQLNC